MLRLSGITIQLGARVVLDGVDLSVADDERLALVGPNGAGKSTLMKVAVGTLAADSGEVIVPRGREVGYLAQELAVAGRHSLWAEASAALQPVLQLQEQADALLASLEHLDHEAPDYSDTLHRIEQLQEAYRVRGGYTAEATIGRVLSGLGFHREDWARPVDDFSGGWQVRIALAKLLLTRPAYILLDEPTNHLDIETRTWLLHELKAYPGGVAIISHDRDFLDHLVRRTVELDGGQITSYAGGYSSFLVQRVERVRILEAQAEQQAEERSRLEAFIRRFRYKATKAAQVQSRVKQLEKMKPVFVPTRRARMRLQFPEPPPANSPVMELRAVSRAYGELEVLKEVEESVLPGERILLVGPNGAGKSTLLRLLAGRDAPTGGSVVTGRGTRRGWFAQDQARELPADSTVLDVMATEDPLAAPVRLRALLGAFLFTGTDVDKRCGILSGGEKSRLALARVLMKRANLLLLDEPTNHLDIDSKDVLAEALGSFSGAVVFVSHDRVFADALATRVWEVGGGGLRSYHGGLEDFLWRRAIELGVVSSRAPGERAPDAWLLGGLPEPADGGAAVAPRAARDEPQPDDGLGYKERKRLRRELERKQKQLDGGMEQIELQEGELKALDADLASPETADDWSRVNELLNQREALDKEIAAAYDSWETLEAEVEELGGRLGE